MKLRNHDAVQTEIGGDTEASEFRYHEKEIETWADYDFSSKFLIKFTLECDPPL
jgi:hypothetical protein